MCMHTRVNTKALSHTHTHTHTQTGVAGNGNQGGRVDGEHLRHQQPLHRQNVRVLAQRFIPGLGGNAGAGVAGAANQLLMQVRVGVGK